ncbi:PHA/PHB synthase family protein [Bradyrhizobium sp.]|uniref:PHA/PHB synthase family protein n=1 Tax=Bradyrhizobium sp. TaxID=376 RepID=UPI004037EC1F
MKPRASASQQLVPFPVQASVVPEGPCACAPPVSPSIADAIDRSLHATIARFTGGVSPAALALAFADWQLHLAASPGKQLALAGEAARSSYRFAQALALPNAKFAPWSLIGPAPADRRFSAPDWELPPFNMMAQAFLLTEQWWHSAASGVRGLSQANAAIADFAMRQCLDMAAPSNFAFGNPEVWRRTMETGGGNLAAGLHNWLEDAHALLESAARGEARPFAVGKDVATAPGKVVYRNRLIELIQYAPQTAEVRPEPVLIVPAWIMKYYILDLSPHNSLVRYLVGQGFTVFMISWRNPTEEDRELGLEDYRKLGIDASIAAINSIVPGQPIHAAGYCLGGTLLSIAAAHLATTRPDCLRSLTLLAAQTDFTEAGELTLFINESQVAFLEDMMWERGVLGTEQMAGAFRILRSNDLIWSRAVRAYLMGERAVPNDLMSWNADATRMPYRMHSEYLRRLFLNNELAEGRYCAGCDLVSLSDLHAPMFVVGTLRDHVAPWRSTYKINYLAADADITYVLASGGHNAGIVAPPGEAGHSYQVLGKMADAPYLGPDEWLGHAAKHEGSWWPEWVHFLSQHSGAPAAAPPLGTKQGTLMDAPGQYVLQS